VADFLIWWNFGTESQSWEVLVKVVVLDDGPCKDLYKPNSSKVHFLLTLIQRCKKYYPPTDLIAIVY
jgi:hypothetical protein